MKNVETTTHAQPITTHTTQAAPNKQRRWLCAPVFWAVLGVLCIAFQIWVFARWAADGNLHSSLSGDYDMPAGLRFATRLEEVVVIAVCVLLVAVAWWQSRTTGHIALSAALITVAYAKVSLKKYRPIAARNEDRNVFSGLL